MTTEKSLIDSALRQWKFNVERAEKLFDLSLGPSGGGERSALTAARDWRKTSSRIRRYVHLEPGQIPSADCLRAIAQSRVARNQSEALGWLREILRLRLGAAAHGGLRRGFCARTASKSLRRVTWKNGAPRLSLGAS